jgi:hypothetical protein
MEWWQSRLNTVRMWFGQEWLKLALRRCAAGMTAVAVVAVALVLPSSRPSPDKAAEERFGPIHWHEPMG